ncbi:hypothetical protein ACN4EE_16400 [Geminocystis sp. CENA526]|uniref:hypothetical protein n=1 Tax=Geminocystis sp. CENA526 TaxID=1355871 RepID=UPI003D6EDB34
MSFNNYKNINDVLQQFPFSYQEDNFIKEIEFNIDPYFVNRLELIIKEGIVFNSEYAICENIISPILVEIWLKYREKLILWSHQPLKYDENLSGIPDYMIAQRSPRGKVILEQPYLILVEAKKDNFEEGWGQCFAELIAVQKLNNNQNNIVFGIVSNGKIWEFGKLQDSIFTKNLKYYTLEELAKLMGAISFLFQETLKQI